MKIVQINSTCGIGSTGKICIAISELLTAENIENYILYAIGKSNYPLGIKYMNLLETKFQAMLSKVFGNYGFQSRLATKRLIKKLEFLSPDIVQLHNLHSHNVNLDMLFTYLRKKKIKIIWTFHDCWSFTAYCPHYTIAKCNQWIYGCKKCPKYKKYSLFFDMSKWLYQAKKGLAQKLNLTIVTPSQWLANEVKKSFFKDYPIEVINNGVDLGVFYPKISNFREKHNIMNDCFVILGVANGWNARKGLDVFVHLAKRLDPKEYKIVLVGTNNVVDKMLPDTIISIHCTQNQHELAEIYSAADLFVNPTREEVLGLVNLEALACGTPGLTSNTGGSPECYDGTCGSIVNCNDADAMEKEIRRIHDLRPFDSQDCINRANMFNKEKIYSKYLDLYVKCFQ